MRLFVLIGFSCATLLLAGCGATETADIAEADSPIEETPPEELAFAGEETSGDEVAPAPEGEGDGLTDPQRNAVRSAESYLDFSGFSRQGLIDQLSSEFADQYAVEDATVAVDSLGVDWNAQAVRSAENYLKVSGFSCQGLIDQLSSEAGDKYTLEEATHGANNTSACQ